MSERICCALTEEQPFGACCLMLGAQEERKL